MKYKDVNIVNEKQADIHGTLFTAYMKITSLSMRNPESIYKHRVLDLLLWTLRGLMTLVTRGIQMSFFF